VERFEQGEKKKGGKKHRGNVKELGSARGELGDCMERARGVRNAYIFERQRGKKGITFQKERQNVSGSGERIRTVHPVLSLFQVSLNLRSKKRKLGKTRSFTKDGGGKEQIF